MDFNAARLKRELEDLDKLEQRVKQTVAPSQVLLREIEKKRHELLNPSEKENAKTVKA